VNKTKLREGTKQTAKDAYANIFVSETRTHTKWLADNEPPAES